MKQVNIFALICLLATNVFASGNQGESGMKKDGNQWMKRRDNRVSKVSERITKLTTHKACFSNSTTKVAFKACKTAMKADMQALRSAHRNKK